MSLDGLGPVSIRIEIEGIRNRVTQMLNLENREINRVIESSVKKHLDSLADNYQALIERVTDEAIKDAIEDSIKRYFSFNGEGGRAIQENVEKFLSSSMPKPEQASRSYEEEMVRGGVWDPTNPTGYRSADPTHPSNNPPRPTRR